MGGSVGKEIPHEDSAYYEKITFELNILVCGNYNERLLLKDLEDIQEEDGEYIKEGKHKVVHELKYFFLKKAKQ